MAKVYDLVRCFTATTGTGALTWGAAVAPFLTPALAGAQSGDFVSYGIIDGLNSEAGRGILTNTAGVWTMTRVPLVSTNSNAAINLSGGAQVFLSVLAEDVANNTGLVPDKDRFAPPLTTDFASTLSTSGSPVVSWTNTKGLTIAFGAYPGSPSGDYIRGVYKAKPAGAFSAVARIQRNQLIYENYHYSGLSLYDSAGGKIIMFGINAASGKFAIDIDYWNSKTSFNSSPAAYGWMTAPEWWRIDDDGVTNLTFYVSNNGTDWMRISQLSRTAFFTTYDSIGLFIGSNPSDTTIEGAINNETLNVLYYDDGVTTAASRNIATAVGIPALGAVSINLDSTGAGVQSGIYTFAYPCQLGQKVIMVPSAALDPTNYDFDELDMDNFTCAAYVSAANTITAFIMAIPGPVTGTRDFNIQVG